MLVELAESYINLILSSVKVGLIKLLIGSNAALYSLTNKIVHTVLYLQYGTRSAVHTVECTQCCTYGIVYTVPYIWYFIHSAVRMAWYN